MIRLLLGALCAAVFWAVPATAGEMLVGRAHAIEGDSLEIATQRVRLCGVDAFEGAQPCPSRTGRA